MPLCVQTRRRRAKSAQMTTSSIILTHQLFRELLSFIIENPGTITRAIRLTFIGKSLERITDHATNIAELVIYMVEGKIIRHTAPPVLSDNEG